MKRRFAIFFGILLALIGLAYVLVQYSEGEVQIELLSAPYPMTVGQMTLTVGLSEGDGSKIEDAQVEVTTQLKRPGSPAILNFPNQSSNGEYHVPITWSMMGQATITVSAELPNQRGTVREEFLVYVYLVPPLRASSEAGYRNLTKLTLEMQSNPSEEYWIFIPQGAQEMLMMGETQSFIPPEILLNLNGQNTLIIRNDDFVDHTIGPFFVRSGETVRQTFNQVAVFEGTCSISHGTGVRIVVEG